MKTVLKQKTTRLHGMIDTSVSNFNLIYSAGCRDVGLETPRLGKLAIFEYCCL